VVPLLRERLVEGKTMAYLCEGMVCRRPTDDPEQLAHDLA
jgi:uncharacterized protein YyaL (SSP411 family)